MVQGSAVGRSDLQMFLIFTANFGFQTQPRAGKSHISIPAPQMKSVRPEKATLPVIERYLQSQLVRRPRQEDLQFKVFRTAKWTQGQS